MAEPFIGEIRIFATSFAPAGWAFCNGQVLPISQNVALFAILQTTYGGDGSSTFALPDLRGRAPMQPGSVPGLTTRTLGQRGGAEIASLTLAQIPAHRHRFHATVLDANSADPAGRVAATNPADYWAQEPAQAAQEMAEEAVGETGGGAPHSNMQPYLTLHFLIALVGATPL